MRGKTGKSDSDPADLTLYTMGSLERQFACCGFQSHKAAVFVMKITRWAVHNHKRSGGSICDGILESYKRTYL